MVERYARVEMRSKWTQEARYAAWLEEEKAAVKAWNKLGLIPDDDCGKRVKNASFNVERIE
ncbi:adenylosuccinate lyase, partial [Aliarcobacter butzleri]